MTCHASCAECQDPLPLLYRSERRCGPFHQRDEGWKLAGLGIEQVEKGEHLGLKSKECVEVVGIWMIGSEVVGIMVCADVSASYGQEA